MKNEPPMPKVSIPPELFPTCARGFHPGMYEGNDHVELQVGKGYKESPWPFTHSRIRPRGKEMGFIR